MSQRSQVPISGILKNATKVLSHTAFARTAIGFQMEKQFFNVLYPNYKNGIANKIRHIGFRITDLCNLRCHTCGQWGDNGYLRDRDLKELRKQEVPYTRYIEMLHDLKANKHTPILYFWGGEPMLYRGLMDVIHEGAKLGMPSSIATNGTRVAKFAEEFCEAPMFLLQISVDGSCEATHNAARPGQSKNHDSFSEVIEAFETLSEMKKRRGQKLPMLVSLTTISRENFFDLTNIYERLKPYTDLQIFYLSWWIDFESATKHSDDFERRFGESAKLPYGWVGDWSKFDYAELSGQLKDLQKRASGFNSCPVYIMPNLTDEADLRKYYTDHSATFGFNQCVSIFQCPEIDSNGDVSPCRDYHDYIVGNIKDTKLTELWNSERYVKFRQSISQEGIMPVCTRCCGLMGY